MKETVYKVVKNLDGCLVSCICTSCRYRLEYPIGEWVRPLIGGIFVFDSLAHARAFHLQNYDSNEIWVAVGENPTLITFISLYPSVGVSIERFWDNYSDMMVKEFAPSGSLVCSEVKLLKRISSAEDSQETS